MTDKPSNVRLAMPEDEDAIFNLLAEGLFNENGAFSLSKEKSRNFIRQAVNHEGGIIGVIEEGGQIVGSIGMNLDSFWYSDDWYISEYWNYVKPQYRKSIGTEFKRSDYAKNLIDFAKWCAERMNLVLNIGILSTQRTEAKQRLYQRKLTVAGAFFFHNLECAKGPGISKISLGRD